MRRWEERSEARVVAVAILKGRKVVAVGGDTGLEISEDGGVTWRPSQPPLDPGSGLSFLAFHPLKPGVLYTGSYRHPFRSTDLGRSWKRIAGGMVEDTQVFHLDFSPTDPDDMWAATCGWVYRTTDGAATWKRYKDGLTDRRTQVVLRDPRNPSRVLAGTTGGLFESLDEGRSFRRISRDTTVVNGLLFDPSNPAVLLVATEAEGILRSEDGGVTLVESNAGLSEARVPAVAVTASGAVVVARAADGGSGGLWALEPATGKAERLAASPAATVRALLSSGDRLLAGTPDGLWLARAPGQPFGRVLDVPVLGLAAGAGRLFAATDAGAFESRDGGSSWARVGTLKTRVDAVLWSRAPGGPGRGARRPLLGEDPLVERPGLRPRGAARLRPPADRGLRPAARLRLSSARADRRRRRGRQGTASLPGGGRRCRRRSRASRAGPLRGGLGGRSPPRGGALPRHDRARPLPLRSGAPGRRLAGRGAQRPGTLRKERRAPGTTPWRFASPAVSSTTVSAGALEG